MGSLSKALGNLFNLLGLRALARLVAAGKIVKWSPPRTGQRGGENTNLRDCGLWVSWLSTHRLSRNHPGSTVVLPIQLQSHGGMCTCFRRASGTESQVIHAANGDVEDVSMQRP